MALTKYELATELKGLMKGMKAVQICKMTKSQLETEIDRIKVLKQLEESIPDYPPAKRGPLGPRPIPVAPAAVEDVIISVPQAPAPKPKTKKKVTLAPVAEPTASAERLVARQPTASAELFPTFKVAASVRAHPSGDKSLPGSSAASAADKSKFSHPGAPKRSHTCNCPGCPEKAIA